jgi:tRNA A37 threonylcarbamoyladenosine synthetase subunit TsaC/SUA5/YrdC
VTRLDIKGDAARAFEIIRNGGIVIAPNDTGYGVLASTLPALQKINRTKGRGGHKRNALLCDLATQRTLHVLDRRAQEMIELIAVDYDLPLGPVAPCNFEHPLLANVDPVLLRTSTADNTIAMLLNAGPFWAELTRLSREEVVPIFGSSANLTGSGPKFRVEDIEPEIRAIADITIDYGLRKYHNYQRSGTIIDFRTMTVVRIGIGYELISDILRRNCQSELPVDPGLAALRSGHLNEFGLQPVESH